MRILAKGSLAISLCTKEVAFQKLDYIHTNPVTKRWQLGTDPCDYPYTSAGYYEIGDKTFRF